MRAALYKRVSSQEQSLEGYSLSAQENILHDYAKINNFVITNIYEDAGISGKNIKDRPGISKLIEDAKQKKFDIVLVWKLSRLSRSLLDLLSIVNIFSQNNISFLSFSEKFDTSTPMGKMVLHMLGSIAEFERDTIVENVKMGLSERFKQGYSKAAIPFGYIHQDKKAVIDISSAEIVKQIFEKYDESDGNCLTFLAEKLNNEGYHTRTGGLWSRITIRDLLQNHFYAGYIRTGVHPHGYKKMANATITKGQHEAIISEDLFNQVYEKLQSMKQSSVIRQPDNESILTGLINCPRCGAKMFALNTYNKYTNKQGELTKYLIRQYRCTNKDRGKGICKGFYFAAEKAEKPVIKALAKFIEDKQFIKNSKEDKKIVKIDFSENELKKMYDLRDKYFKLFDTGKVDIDKFADKINSILSDIEKLENKKILNLISGEINYDLYFDRITDFYTMYNNLPNIDKKTFIRQFVKSVNMSLDKYPIDVELTNNKVILLSQ